MRIILIGNYSKDKQESMNRFAKALYLGYKQKGIDTEIWLPTVLFAKLSQSTYTGLGKWLGYLDKLIVFPLKLKLELLKKKNRTTDVRFHICDHSNSFYLNFLPKNRTLITCHDVLAIRGALGYTDAYCPASKSGVILQKWILNNLSSAKKLVAVSKFTMDQLNDLLPRKVKDKNKWKVVHNGFNEDFFKMDADRSAPLLNKIGISPIQPYLLHIGSNLARKNRKMLLDMVYNLGNKYTGKICFAGQAIDDDLMDHATSLGLNNRLISVINPDHFTLVALYSNCEAFVFPSFSEGFGWPIIEAQVCGAPVITSLAEPFHEVADIGALYANPHDSGAFANEFLKLGDNDNKIRLIQNGFINCLRFNSQQMVNAYLNLHLA